MSLILSNRDSTYTELQSTGPDSGILCTTLYASTNAEADKKLHSHVHNSFTEAFRPHSSGEYRSEDFHDWLLCLYLRENYLTGTYMYVPVYVMYVLVLVDLLLFLCIH